MNHTIQVKHLEGEDEYRSRQLIYLFDFCGENLDEHVKEELAFAQRLFTAHASWPVIDVTGRAIEETAVIILESLKEREDKVRAVQAQLG